VSIPFWKFEKANNNKEILKKIQKNCLKTFFLYFFLLSDEALLYENPLFIDLFLKNWFCVKKKNGVCNQKRIFPIKHRLVFMKHWFVFMKNRFIVMKRTGLSQ
jgi:hypothetical protein